MNITVTTKVGRFYVNAPKSIVFKKYAIIFKGNTITTDHDYYPSPNVKAKNASIRIEKDDIKSISIQ